MKLRIDPVIFTHYPQVKLAVAVMHNISNDGTNEEIQSMLRSAEEKAIAHVGNLPVTEHPNIVPWREAYKNFGAKPKKYPSSIENLVRKILAGEHVRHINKLVDIYNIISLTHLVPVGGEDIDTIEGDVNLTFAGDSEVPVKLLGEADERPPYKDEVIYKDTISTICRRWNWKEADRTKLTESTTSAFIVIEGLPPVRQNELEVAAEQLKELIKKYCGEDVATAILDQNTPEVELK